MLACLAVTCGGLCERRPKIRIAFLESGGGWIAPWLDRMDRHFDDQFFNDSSLKAQLGGAAERPGLSARYGPRSMTGMALASGMVSAGTRRFQGQKLRLSTR